MTSPEKSEKSEKCRWYFTEEMRVEITVFKMEEFMEDVEHLRAWRFGAQIEADGWAHFYLKQISE